MSHAATIPLIVPEHGEFALTRHQPWFFAVQRPEQVIRPVMIKAPEPYHPFNSPVMSGRPLGR